MTVVKNFEKACAVPRGTNLYKLYVARRVNTSNIIVGKIIKGQSLGASYGRGKMVVWETDRRLTVKKVYRPVVTTGIHLLFRSRGEAQFWKSYLDGVYINSLSPHGEWGDGEIISNYVDKNYKKITRLYKESKDME